MATTSDMALELGISRSGASRLRHGHRIASYTLLMKIHEQSGIPLDQLTKAAAKAQETGDRADWTELMEQVFGGADEDEEEKATA